MQHCTMRQQAIVAWPCPKSNAPRQADLCCYEEVSSEGHGCSGSLVAGLGEKVVDLGLTVEEHTGGSLEGGA